MDILRTAIFLFPLAMGLSIPTLVLMVAVQDCGMVTGIRKMLIMFIVSMIIAVFVVSSILVKFKIGGV